MIAQVEDGLALVRAAERLSPDVIVSDISMPGLDGIAAATEILRKNPAARIIFVTVHCEPIAAGAWLRNRGAGIRAEARGGRRTDTGRPFGAARRTSRQSTPVPCNRRPERLERFHVCPEHVVVTSPSRNRARADHAARRDTLGTIDTRDLRRHHAGDCRGPQRVAEATHVDACQLLEFSESGSVARAHVPTPVANDRWRTARVAGSRRLARRAPRARRVVVAISRRKNSPRGDRGAGAGASSREPVLSWECRHRSPARWSARS